MDDPMVFSASKDTSAVPPKPPDKSDDGVRQCKASFASKVMGSKTPLPAREKVDLIACISLLCSHCGYYGHLARNCPRANLGTTTVNQPPTEGETVDSAIREGAANGLSSNQQIPIFTATEKSTHGDWMLVERRKNIRKGTNQGANFQGGKKGNVSNPFTALSREDKGDLNASRAVFSSGVSPTKEPIPKRKWVRKRMRSNGVKIHEQSQDQTQKGTLSKNIVHSSTNQPKATFGGVEAMHTEKGGTMTTTTTSQHTLHDPMNGEKAQMKGKESQAPKPSFKSAMNIEWVSGNKFRFLDDDEYVGLKSPHLLAWNIRGAVNKNGRRYAKELVLRHQPEIVVIMETHCSFAAACSFWSRLGFSKTGIVEARGHSGGIWVLTRNGSNFSFDVLDIFSHCVTFSIARGACKWVCSTVYASPVATVRDNLWDHLVGMQSSIILPWLLIGDFNEILLPSELPLLPVPRLEEYQVGLLSAEVSKEELVWSLLHEHDKLWVQVLTHKYLSTMSILQVAHPGSCSFVWKGILRARDALKNGFLIRLGQGDLSFWYDKWIPNCYLCELVDYVHITDSALRVKDVWLNGAWHLSGLYTPRNNHVRELINSIPVPCASVCQDTVVWIGNSDGIYTVSSAYRWLGESLKGWCCHPGSSSWVWRLKVPAKIQFFAWLVSLDALPTNAFRMRRNLCSSAACDRCSSSEESLSHVLQDCPHAHEVWLRLGFSTLPNFWTDPINLWFKRLLQSNLAHTFAAAVWWIWRWRNNFLFDEKRWNIQWVLRTIASDIEAFSQWTPLSDHVVPRAPKQRLVSWSFPPPHSIKVNVDGSCGADRNSCVP
ncbi:hypothetical protein RIF29_10902 [Crotalaria pallida]|uniref:CCHC-type domain-containing protein n=1 Tax=Crotalaria pallida TaxID=3830 RepID=A0AAN9G0E1_CROPI